MKILLISYFSNSEIRRHLDLRNRSIIPKFVLRILGLGENVEQFREFGSWITNITTFFENQKDYELHVVSPHIRLRDSIESFNMRGIHYYFYRAEYSSLLRKIGNYRIWSLLQKSASYTKKILKMVNPDIVILSGAENPVASISILSANKYPCLCLCQVIYNDSERFQYSTPDKLKLSVERAVFNSVQNFGVYCKKHYTLLNQLAPGKNIFKFNWPPKAQLLSPSDIKKEFDFVNFANAHSLAKGTHDSIRALAKVKKLYPNVTLNIVGGCSKSLRTELDCIINELDVVENVVFTPFFENRSDLFYHIQKSRFAILPCKLDNTSATMSQAMLLKLPVIVYATPGTIEFNRKKECALVVDKNDIDGLASQMVLLLTNHQKAEQLKENGRWFKESQSNEALDNWKRLVNSFTYIIDNFKTGASIPDDILFNPKVDE